MGGIRISKSFLEIETLGQNVVLHECALNSILRAGVYQNLDWRNTNPEHKSPEKHRPENFEFGGWVGAMGT